MLFEGLARGSSPVEYIRIYGSSNADFPLKFLEVLRLQTMREMRIFISQETPPFGCNIAQFTRRVFEFECALLADRKLYEMVVYEQ